VGHPRCAKPHAAVRGIRIEATASRLEGDLDLRGLLGRDAGRADATPRGPFNRRRGDERG
jgi:hypothetical protein